MRFARRTEKPAKSFTPTSTRRDKRAPRSWFKEVAAASVLLSDPDKRARFDAGEIDAAAEKAPPNARHHRDYAGEKRPFLYQGHGAYGDFAQGDDMFAGARRCAAEQARRRPGADLHYELQVEFDAVNGATRTITLPGGGTLQVTIPPGVEDGQILRLRGKGAPSPGEGDPGDALVQIVVRPHRVFTREGDNILLDLPVTVKEAALGAEVRAPTTTGSVMLRIPKRSNTGDMLRLRGKGVKKRAGAGDELVTLKVMMPTEAEPELETFLANWTPASHYDPRKDL